MTEVFQRFETLARETLDRAEQIDCTIPEFVTGLTAVIDHLADARSAAESAWRATGGSR